MIEHLIELCKYETPITLSSLFNSFDKIYDYKTFYETGMLKDHKLDSWIEGKINGFFVSITLTPFKSNLGDEIEENDGVDDTDEVIIVDIHVQLCNYKYCETFYKNEED